MSIGYRVLPRDTPEGKFKQFIIDDLRHYERSGLRFKYWATLDVQAGIPDIVGCVYSRGLFIELKAEHTIQRELQLEALDDWHHAGGIAGILREKSDHLQWTIGGHGEKICLNRATWFQELLHHYLGSIRNLLQV